MVIAITSGSRSKASKLSAALRKALSDSDTLTAGFRYPVCKIARMFGWDNKHDERGKKLINTLYNAGIEYDKNVWLDKMDAFIKRAKKQKKSIIITDMDSPEQARKIRDMESVRLIVCGDNDILHRSGLIDIYVDSDRTVDDIVGDILRKINDTTD